MMEKSRLLSKTKRGERENTLFRARVHIQFHVFTKIVVENYQNKYK